MGAWTAQLVPPNRLPGAETHFEGPRQQGRLVGCCCSVGILEPRCEASLQEASLETQASSAQ